MGIKDIIKFTLLFIVNIAFAQYPVESTTSLANEDDRYEHTKQGNYAMDTANEREQYVGLWRYQENGILFELKIELLNQKINLREFEEQSNYYYMDRVSIRYKLVKNGITLHDNINSPNIEQYVSYGFKYGSSEYLRGRMIDYTRNVIGQYTIKKLNTSPEKIIFNLGEFNYRRLNPDSFYQAGVKLFSIPVGDLEMVKVD
jgi:hypothetical protein